MVNWSTRKLVALKSHKYGTRQLTAGEEYEAKVEDAIAQVALRNADFLPLIHRPKKQPPPVLEEKVEPAAQVDATVEPPQPEPEPPAQQQNHEHSNHALDRLRLEATSLGINVDGRWGVARLRHEIDQAKR